MSWFTDLAGKAEDFLVKIDENAAVAAQVISKEKNTSKLKFSSPVTPTENGANENDPVNSGAPPATTSSGKTLKLDRDSTLMASLNLSNSTDNDSKGLSAAETVVNFTSQRENDLLKQEVRSINQEMRKSVQNGRQLEKDCKIARQQLTEQTATVKSLESQLAAIKSEKKLLFNQILDKDAELLTIKSKVEALHVDKEYQLELGNIQGQLEAEVSQRKALEDEMKSLQADFDRERAALVAEAQTHYEQLQVVKNELAVTHQSHTEYKFRAQRILQDKDKLFQVIKQQQSVEGIQSSELTAAELDQLQRERDLLREELSQINSQLIQCRKELTIAETRCEDEWRKSRRTIVTMEERLADEAIKKELTESELRQLNEELKFVRHDLSLQKLESVSRVALLETQLEKLRSQLISSRQNGSPSSTEIELEKRLRAVTGTLIAKQAALEELQSERSSLMLQLERSNSHRDVNNSSRPSSSNDGSTRLLLNITDDAKVTTGVSRRVRSAYSTLDSLNFRLGQALRRRPAARLSIVIYMIMLHLWVFFVLVTYSPEMHK